MNKNRSRGCSDAACRFEPPGAVRWDLHGEGGVQCVAAPSSLSSYDLQNLVPSVPFHGGELWCFGAATECYFNRERQPGVCRSRVLWRQGGRFSASRPDGSGRREGHQLLRNISGMHLISWQHFDWSIPAEKRAL